MLANTQISLASVIGALAIGGLLLVLVAWVDRRYLQRFEDVRSADEEARSRGATPPADAHRADRHAARRPPGATVRDALPDLAADPVVGPPATTAEPPPSTEAPRRSGRMKELATLAGLGSEPVDAADDAGEAVPPPTTTAPDASGRWQRPADPATAGLRPERDAGPRLPRGAEAALLSIIEVVPDPRNTLAVTRDPTAEVRPRPTTDSQRVA